MSTQETHTEVETDNAKRVRILAGMLLFVIKGIRNKSIKSKPILNMEPGAEQIEPTTLEDEIWKVLNKCGITERK